MEELHVGVVKSLAGPSTYGEELMCEEPPLGEIVLAKEDF